MRYDQGRYGNHGRDEYERERGRGRDYEREQRDQWPGEEYEEYAGMREQPYAMRGTMHGEERERGRWRSPSRRGESIARRGEGIGSYGQYQGGGYGEYGAGSERAGGFERSLDRRRYSRTSSPNWADATDREQDWNGLDTEGRQRFESEGMTTPWHRTERSYRDREFGRYVGKGPKGYHRSDERIREDVQEALTRDGMVDASDIDVSVQNGEVTLTGTVSSREQKREAEDCAEDISGVQDVQNHLRVSREGSEGNQRDWSSGTESGTQRSRSTSTSSSTTRR